jgi:hypothetical protein
MLNKDQSQTLSEGATAIQAGESVTVVHIGVTASEARLIALDVAKVTFYELTGAAKETASVRVEEITDKVIKKLEIEFPEGLQKARDPDFQYALRTVQKEYARNGDEDLGDLLVDLLVDRSKQDQRDILQIVLNESLATAPKLTDTHLAALAVIFLFKYTQNFRIGNHQLFGDYLDKHLLPFVTKLSKNHAGYQHLEFSACGSIGLSGGSLEGILGTVYQGQFLKGFDQSEITSRAISIGVDSRFFIPCLNDETKLQVKANSKEGLEKHLDSEGVSSEDKANILALFELGKMSEAEIREKLITIRPYMAEVCEIWSNSPMQTFTLTSVGMAIGHANIKRLIGEFADLSIWIN